MQTITYSNKSTLYANGSIPDANKVNAADMNEIKSVVNSNASETENLFGGLFDYSTTENDTGQTWINNKPIYRKVVEFGNLPNNTSKTVAHGISNLETFVKCDFIATRSSDKDTLFIPYSTFNTNNTGGIIFYMNSVNIYATTVSDRSAYSGVIILEYTKTTD